MEYVVIEKLSVPGLARTKFADLSTRERRMGHRTIGGDQGDLHFNGFDLDEDNNETILRDPILATELTLTMDEVYSIAKDVLYNSIDSIGLESVEHS